MPFFQGATDFEINGGSFQDMRDQYNHHRDDSFNIHGNNNKTEFTPNYSRTDNRVYDSRNTNMQGYTLPEQNHASGPLPQSYAPPIDYEQLYQMQLLELQRANLQLQLAASAAVSQPQRVGNANILQISERPHDIYSQQQQLHNLPQLFPPPVPLPPNIPHFPQLPQIPPQPAPGHQQHLPVPGPEAFLGPSQLLSSPGQVQAVPGLGAMGAVQQRFERLAQQAPASNSPAQPSTPQPPPPAGATPSPAPANTTQTSFAQGIPQEPYPALSAVQSSLAVLPTPTSTVGLSMGIGASVARPTTASSLLSSSSSSSSSSDSSSGREVRPVSVATPSLPTLASPQTIPANTAAPIQTAPIASAVAPHQSTFIENTAAPRPLATQIVNTGPSPSTTQVVDAPSTTQIVNAAAGTTNPSPASTGPPDLQTSQNVTASPSLQANFAMYPVPVPITSPVAAPSASAISSVTVRPLLSFPVPSASASSGISSTTPGSGGSGNSPDANGKKKRGSWLGRKFSNFKKKSKD